MITQVGTYRCKTPAGIRWCVRWYGRYDPQTGKSKRYSKTFNLKKDADKFQKQKEKEFQGGAQRDTSTETLKEYCELWLKNRTRIRGLMPGTVTLYREAHERLYDFFGQDTLMRRIDRRMAQAFIAELKPINKKRIKSLSSWSRDRVLRECKTLFADAECDGVVVKNPFAKIKGPKTKSSPWYRVKPDEYRELLSVTPTVREKTLYALAYTGGLRLTEALALRWEEIDFVREEVHVVNRPATETLPPFFVKDYEARTIPLPRHTIVLLLELQEQSPEKVPYVLLTESRYRRVIAKWQKCKAEGKPWYNKYYANNSLREFKKRTKRAGIKPGNKTLSIHTLRKNYCQNLVDGGLPITTVKELMGHADISTTQKYYTTVEESHREKAVALQNELLNLGLDKDGTDVILTFSGNLDSDDVSNEGTLVGVSSDNIDNYNNNSRA